MAKIRKICNFGPEVEGFAYWNGSSERVDLPEVLGLKPENNFRLVIPGLAVIGTDNGRHQVEFSLDPCRKGDEIGEKIEACQAYLPSDVKVYWTGQDPFVQNGSLPPTPWTKKQRYHAIRRVVARERPDLYPHGPGHPEMDWMAQYAAIHIHIEIDPSSEEGVRLMRILNNWGPHIARSAHANLGGNTPCNRIERAWVGWGDKRRLPGYHSFGSPAEMLYVWQRLPRVARQASNGLWVPDRRRKLLTPGNPLDEGFVWWGCRPRWSLGTIEFRWPNSLPPEHVPTFTSSVLEFAEAVLDGWEPYRFPSEEWEGIRNSHAYWQQYGGGVDSPISWA